MRELARVDASLPAIQELARFVRDPLGLDFYLRSYWRYKPDPEAAEYVMSPEFQLNQAIKAGYFEGDCDDAATLAGAVALAIGSDCRFTAYRLPGRDEFSHVNLRCLVSDGSLFDVDPTVSPAQLPILGAEELMELSL